MITDPPQLDATATNTRPAAREDRDIFRLAPSMDAGVLETPWNEKDGRLRIRMLGPTTRSQP